VSCDSCAPYIEMTACNMHKSQICMQLVLFYYVPLEWFKISFLLSFSSHGEEDYPTNCEDILDLCCILVRLLFLLPSKATGNVTAERNG